MDNDKYKDVINKFIECNELISKNEEYLKNIQNNNNNDENLICYLIDYSLFKKLKEDLSYEIFTAIQKDEYEINLKKK